jgi:hypothetical protein
VTQPTQRNPGHTPLFKAPINRFSADLRRILPLCLLGGTVFWLVSVAEALFSGSLNVAESLGSLWLFVVAALILCLPLRGLVSLSRPFERYLIHTRWLGALLVTLAAAYPLADLLVTRRAWAWEFLFVSLGVTALIFLLVLVGWRYASLKFVWLIGTLLSAWFFYDVVENEGLILRAGEDLFDLPTLVLFMVSLGTAATGFLVTRFAQSLAGRLPQRIEAAATLAGGLFIGFAAGEVIDVHYENIFQVTVFFAFIATLHGISRLRLNLPYALSLPPLALLLLVGGVLALPFEDKPEEIALVHAELGQKSRTVEEIFKVTGLAEGEQRVAVCRLHKIAQYPEGEFSEQFQTSLERVAYRPSTEELTANPQRPVLGGAKPWNVLFITVDSLRYDRTAYSGFSDGSKTPVLTALAERSQRFHRAYPQGAWTSLSIPSLMWSKPPSAIRFVPIYEDRKLNLYLKKELTDAVVVRSVFQVPLPEKGPTLAGRLNKAGVKTVAVVNDGRTGFFNPRLGLSKDFQAVHYTDTDGRDARAVEMASAALGELGEEPFFFWIHLFDVHKASQKPDDARERQLWRDYDYRISVVDGYIGRILKRLEEQGLADSTVVILTGDHGESFGELGVKGHGLGINNASIHVPLLIRIPGLPPADYHRPVALMDIAPTVMDLTGHGAKVPKAWRGTSLAPMLVAGEDIDHPPVYVESWRRKLKGSRKRLHRAGVMYGKEKVTIFFDRMELGFYDLTSLRPAEEKPLYPRLDPEVMSDSKLHMVKHLLEWKSKDVDRRCD